MRDEELMEKLRGLELLTFRPEEVYVTSWARGKEGKAEALMVVMVNNTKRIGVLVKVDSMEKVNQLVDALLDHSIDIWPRK